VATPPRLSIKLHKEWHQVENPNGPITYLRGRDRDAGALQFSFAKYRQGTLKNATEETLIGICEKLSNRVQGRRNALSHSGKCDFGIFGTLAVEGDYPVRFQAWVISNRSEFILVTHTCTRKPELAEIAEASEIALMTSIL
jgi:hypothetical protein